MYEEPALNHHWLRHCHRFRELRLASKGENTAEAGLHRALAHHPLRTHVAADATLFYVPIWEYSSSYVGATCNGSLSASSLAAPPAAHVVSELGALARSHESLLRDHRSRMAAARDALLVSPHWLRFGGRDHIWATTAFSAHGYSLHSRSALLPPAPL